MMPPVPPLKLLLRKRRNSPPNLMECLPRIQASGVGVLERGVAAALREAGDAAEPRIAAAGAAHFDLRHHAAKARSFRKSAGLPVKAWVKVMQHPIQAGVKFVGEGRAEKTWM